MGAGRSAAYIVDGYHPRALRNCLTNPLSLRCHTVSRFPFLRLSLLSVSFFSSLSLSPLSSLSSAEWSSNSLTFPASHSFCSPLFRHLTSRISPSRASPSKPPKTPLLAVVALFSQRSISASPNPASRNRSACLERQARRSRSASSALSQSSCSLSSSLSEASYEGL